MTFIAPDNDRVGRDLLWLANCPEIISVPVVSEQMAREVYNCQQFLQPSPEKIESAKPTHRLGVYFEQLCQMSLSASGKVEIVAANQQIIRDKHTHGEFDLILRAASKLIHLEMAVKFYLQVGVGDELSDWVGPNLKDRFDVKYQRLVGHQMLLSEQSVARDWLTENNLQVSAIGLLTRGRLYYPYEKFILGDFIYPPEVAKEHLKGFWLTTTQLIDELDNLDSQWFELPRALWLAEIAADDIAELKSLSHAELDRVTAVVVLEEQKEVMRGFVVPDDWLVAARQRIKE